MNIELEDDLAERLEQRAKANGFDSTREYTRMLIRTVLNELDRVESDGEVEKRLEDLGYL